ncbi:hypothetical protein VUR80DRAFT_7213 [Thermomyces stellatus]
MNKERKYAAKITSRGRPTFCCSSPCPRGFYGRCWSLSYSAATKAKPANSSPRFASHLHVSKSASFRSAKLAAQSRGRRDGLVISSRRFLTHLALHGVLTQNES